jgi:hypothetical protein
VNAQFPVTGWVAIPRRQFAKNSHGEKSPDKFPRTSLTFAVVGKRMQVACQSARFISLDIATPPENGTDRREFMGDCRPLANGKLDGGKFSHSAPKLP